MPFVLNSPVRLFDNPEYGTRLLFQNGIANPRDLLGKNGVTFHGWFSSFFYKTIPLQATVIDENGDEHQRVFYVNRNSLIKYIGNEDVLGSQTDENVIAELNEKLWDSEDLNDPAQKEIQILAGTEGLRHAGRHNTRAINNWYTSFKDYINASFLGWLYQKTIGGVDRIKARFLFVGTEEALLEAGEVLATQRFHESYRDVSAYTAHVTRFNGRLVDNAVATFQDIPITSKESYIKYQQHDSDTHFYGRYPTRSKTDTSTGTTGHPTEWVRGEQELETVKKSLQLAAKIQFGERPLSYINAFALGPWATGLTTYELMRETGSVFATGPDKDKILDKLTNIIKYEKRQLDLAVAKFKSKYPALTGADELFITSAIEQSLRGMLRNRELNLDNELAIKFAAGSPRIKDIFNTHGAEILAIAAALNKDKQQIIIAGYPPFLKDLTAHAQAKGIDFASFCAVGVVGGQAISEAMREQLLNHGFNKIYSSYGASDLDINLGVETEYEITVRKAIEKNPGLGRELFGQNKGLPMVFHYDPMNYHVESDDEDQLIFTCTRNDRSSPRVRYDLGDKGRVYASSDVQALLTKYGIFQKPKTNLPLMFVWGRDSTVVFNGANLAFTELERAVTDHEELEQHVLKKAFYTYEDDEGAEQLEIWLELNDDVPLPTDAEGEGYAQALLNGLATMNQDFRYQLEQLGNGTKLPVVRFFTRGNSPISEAGGHRKQVLIFNQANLPENYELPSAGQCKAIGLSMSAAILASEAPAVMNR